MLYLYMTCFENSVASWSESTLFSSAGKYIHLTKILKVDWKSFGEQCSV